MKIPVSKPDEVIRILKKHGFLIRRQTGSHVILRHPQTNKMAIVPYHRGKDIKKGTMSSIIKQSGLPTEYFA